MRPCRTRNLRAVQLLFGHTKVESTARHLGVEVDDALDIAEQIDIRLCPLRGAERLFPAFLEPGKF